MQVPENGFEVASIDARVLMNVEAFPCVVAAAEQVGDPQFPLTRSPMPAKRTIARSMYTEPGDIT